MDLATLPVKRKAYFLLAAIFFNNYLCSFCKLKILAASLEESREGSVCVYIYIFLLDKRTNLWLMLLISFPNARQQLQHRNVQEKIYCKTAVLTCD